MEQLRTAPRIRPDSAEAHNDPENGVLPLHGRLKDAIAEYRTALRLDPGLAEAVGEFEDAIRLKPDYAGAHDNPGNLLSNLPGPLAETIVEYPAALRIRPDFATAHSHLENALSRTPGWLEDAITEQRAAIRGHGQVRDSTASASQCGAVRQLVEQMCACRK